MTACRRPRRSLGMLLVVALAGAAEANGRPTNVQTITFRPDSPDHVVAGATFGALITEDGGATWRWMCEAAVGYAGIYDPDFVYLPSGDILATTFGGLRANRDGCTFELAGLGSAFVSQVEIGDGSAVVHAAVADPSDSNIYTSTDDAASFPTSSAPGLPGDWWQALAVAPSDRQRLYLSGYRIVDGVRVPLVYTSADGGATFSPMTTSGMTGLSQSSVISVAGVSPTTPTTVYALLTFENSTMFDAVYVSTDTGANWTRLIGGLQPLSFLARSNGELVAVGPTMAKRSTDAGATWSDLVSPPLLSCLAERPDGVVWACVKDYTPGAARIMASSDLTTWTSVLKFSEIAAPVDCPPGTPQNDTCEAQWCYLRRQMSIIPDPTGCDPAPDGVVDGLTDGGPADASTTTIKSPGDGCCDSGSQGVPGVLLAGVVVAGALVRRRRRHGATSR